MPDAILEVHDLHQEARDRVGAQLGPAGPRGSAEYVAYFAELAAWAEWGEWSPPRPVHDQRPDWRQQ